MVVLATAATVIESGRGPPAPTAGQSGHPPRPVAAAFIPHLGIANGQIYIPRVTGVLLVASCCWLPVPHVERCIRLRHRGGHHHGSRRPVKFIVIGGSGTGRCSVVLIVAPLVLRCRSSANLMKLLEGAWAPILFGASMVLLILTWRRGTNILAQKTRRTEVPLNTLLTSLEKHPPHVVPGTAVFLTSQPEFAPTALLHNLKHNKILHEHNVILTIITTDTPRVTEASV
jgi:KUP system potassium uptake protein